MTSKVDLEIAKRPKFNHNISVKKKIFETKILLSQSTKNQLQPLIILSANQKKIRRRSKILFIGGNKIKKVENKFWSLNLLKTCTYTRQKQFAYNLSSNNSVDNTKLFVFKLRYGWQFFLVKVVFFTWL